MMRKLLLAGVLTVAVPSLSPAAPLCVAGDLDSYLALGGTGCLVGGATVFDFTATVLLPAADPIASSDVTVSPTAGIGLGFGVSQSASAGELFDILIGFSISGPSLSGNVLSMFGSSAFGDGNVTGVQDICIGDVFAGSDPGGFCGNVETLIVVEDAFGLVSPESRSFAPASFFDVFLQITVDGGLAGTSSLDGVVTTEFAPAVHEPASLLLVITGAVGFYFFRRNI